MNNKETKEKREAREAYEAYQDRLSMQPCFKKLTEEEIEELKKQGRGCRTSDSLF